MKPKRRVLILCTGNSCRSQMAEAIWRHEAGNRYQVVSAGTEPKPIHPLTLVSLKEIGVPAAGLRSKPLAEFASQPFDLLVTVCDHARETCPVFPAAIRQEHWPFDDPAAAPGANDIARVANLIRLSISGHLAKAQGHDAELLQAFRRARDAIRKRIRQFLKERGETGEVKPVG